MISSTIFPIFFVLLLIIKSISLSSAQPSFWFHACGKTGNFTNNSKFESNLNSFLSSITSGNHTIGSDAHFYNFTIGTKPSDDGFLSGEAYCRGDLSLSDCHSCCTDAAGEIRQLCPNQKEAIGWYRDCTIRYSNRAIVGNSESFPRFAVANPSNATDPMAFTMDLTTLLKSLQLKASAAFPLKYASGWRKVDGNGSETVYAVLQCTGDLNASACSKCVQNIIDYVPSCCYGKKGGVILTPNCASRYDVYQFYRASDEIATPSLSKDHYSRRKRKSLLLTIFMTTAIYVAILLIVGILIIRLWRKVIQNTDKEIEEIIAAESLQFDLATIKAATCNFSVDNKLGEGGFGEVYKGRLGNGQEIAVKRLSKDSGQGVKELKTEVVLVAKLQHKNLVKLLGFCLASKEKILVYEFLPNSSLDRFLFDPTTATQLDWKTRFKIIVGIARGLLYLHEDSRLMVIHRDLKTSNILLDESMNPKISDFGLAKLFVMDQTQGDTRRIVGTYGYMAPEYAMTGRFSVKSDVFSFGVIVLEIVSGQKVNGYFGEQQHDEALVYRTVCS